MEAKQPRPFLRHFVYLLTLMLLLIPILSIDVFAQSTEDSNQTTETTLAENETIDGPGFFGGDIIQIDGTVDGTTFAAGQVVHVNGTINGALFVAAQTVIINGTVTGNVYGAGQTLTLTSQNEGDVFLAGATINIQSTAQLGRDLFIAGSTLTQEAEVPRHLYAGGDAVLLNAPIGGNAIIDAEQLTLQGLAAIEGDLKYSSPNEATIHSDATVNGETDWQRRTAPQERMQQPVSTQVRIGRILLGMLWGILSALLVWLLFKIWREDFWMDAMEPIPSIPLKTMGIGLLTLIVVPILAILLLITIIGIPLSLILGALYAIALYLSKIVIAVFIGSWLTYRFGWSGLRNEIWIVLMGLIILELIGLIPYVDFIVGVIGLITGLGALVLVLSNRWRPPGTSSMNTVH